MRLITCRDSGHILIHELYSLCLAETTAHDFSLPDETITVLRQVFGLGGKTFPFLPV